MSVAFAITLHAIFYVITICTHEKSANLSLFYMTPIPLFLFSAHYEPVTVLFSDVVSFAYIIAKCNPSETVEMLTTLHKKFNRICRVHETYRVRSWVYKYASQISLPLG